ncbi:MAG: Crp/Fnr family transcriptional regulator [Bryobacteraceae bacterium]|jgi:CRP-like cAMP-binding protein
MAAAMVQTDLLNGLAGEDGDRVLALGRRILLASGAELFHLGDEAECIYVIAQGRLRLTLPMQVRGQEQNVLVEERVPGQTVGWSALIPPYRFTLTATAPLETEVVALPREALRKHFAAYPEAGYVVSLNLASVIGERLQLFQAMWVREVQRMVEMRSA